MLCWHPPTAQALKLPAQVSELTQLLLHLSVMLLFQKVSLPDAPILWGCISSWRAAAIFLAAHKNAPAARLPNQFVHTHHQTVQMQVVTQAGVDYR